MFCVQKQTMKIHPIHTKISAKLIALRNQAKLSQEEVAETLDISQPAYNRMESGQTSIDIKHLFVLSNLFQIPVSELLGKKSQVIIQDNQNNAHVHIAGNMNFGDNANKDKEKIIALLEQRIKELESKL